MKCFRHSIKKNVLSVAAILITVLLAVPVMSAQEGTQVYLLPVSSDDRTIVLEVMADNVADLYGAEFRLTYDPALLTARDANESQDGIQIEPGSLLPVDQGFVVANEVSEVDGEIVFAITLLNPAPAANGRGPLARITFDRLQNDATVIDITHVKLVSRDLQTIPHETIAFSIAGARTVSPPAADRQTDTTLADSNEPAVAETGSFPWWIVAAAIIVIGILVLAGLIVVGNAKSQPIIRPVTPSSQAGKSTYTAGPTGTRPSAFKQQTFPPEVSEKQAKDE